MSRFRVVRQFTGNALSEPKAYRVESVEPMTENEAFKLLEDLGSPYVGRKYEETPAPPRHVAAVGSEVKTRSGTFPSIPWVKQEDGSWKPKYENP